MPSKPSRLVSSKTEGSVRWSCVHSAGSLRASLALILLVLTSRPFVLLLFEKVL